MNNNILFISHDYFIGGGSNKVLFQVSQELINNNLFLLTFYKEDNDYSFLGKKYCLNEDSHKHRNYFIKLFYLIKRAYQIAYISKQNKIDLLFVFCEESHFASVLSKIFGCKAKIILSNHGNIVSNWKTFKILIFIFYRFANKISVLGNYQKNILVNNFFISDKKIEVISNFIDENEIDNLLKQCSSLDFNLNTTSYFKFLHIGRLSKEKNQKLLMQAFDIFNKKHQNSQLLILGKGPLEKELKDYKTSLNSKDNIIFLGVDSNPFKYLIKSDCFLFSSKNEGLPLVLLEALYCGVPIISTDCKTGPRDILSKKPRSDEIKGISQEEFGILVEQNNNPELFAQAMEKMYLDRELREKYIIKGKERIKYYSKERIMKQWIDLLSNL